MHLHSWEFICSGQNGFNTVFETKSRDKSREITPITSQTRSTYDGSDLYENNRNRRKLSASRNCYGVGIPTPWERRGSFPPGDVAALRNIGGLGSSFTNLYIPGKTVLFWCLSFWWPRLRLNPKILKSWRKSLANVFGKSGKPFGDVPRACRIGQPCRRRTACGVPSIASAQDWFGSFPRAFTDHVPCFPLFVKSTGTVYRRSHMNWLLSGSEGNNCSLYRFECGQAKSSRWTCNPRHGRLPSRPAKSSWTIRVTSASAAVVVTVLWRIILVEYCKDVDLFFNGVCLGPGFAWRWISEEYISETKWTNTTTYFPGIWTRDLCWSIMTDKPLSYSVSPDWDLKTWPLLFISEE